MNANSAFAAAGHSARFEADVAAGISCQSHDAKPVGAKIEHKNVPRVFV